MGIILWPFLFSACVRKFCARVYMCEGLCVCWMITVGVMIFVASCVWSSLPAWLYFYLIHLIGIADIEFNFVIGKDGRAYEGRGWNRIGYNTPYWDEVSLSFSVMGSYSSKRPKTDVMQTMKRMIDCGVKLGKITGDYKLYGHRDVYPCTTCPGLKLYDVIKTWAHYDSNTPVKPTS